MTETLAMTVTLVAAMGWVIFQQILVNRQRRQMKDLAMRVRFLETVLFDVANGEADVWIEDDELRGARRTPRNTSLH